MNSKEQQIWEMAEVIFERGVALEALDFIYKSDHFERIATALYNAGYRKIPVRNGKNRELSSVGKILHLLGKGFTQENVALLFNFLEERDSKVRKETARVIFGKIKETLIINNEENTEYFDYDYTLETIDELAKQFGVEV